MRGTRAWHLILGVLIVVSLLIQVGLAIDASALPKAHEVGTLRGTHLAGRLIRTFSFFTIQSNVLCAIAALRLWRHPDESGRWWMVIRLAGLFGITVTGIVYGTVLSVVHDPQGWAEVSTNFVFHYLAPAMTVLGWLLFGPRPRIDGPTATRALVWPVLWSGWALLHGAITDWYPYPFVDVVTHGYLRVLVNATLVLALLAAVVTGFRFGDRRLPPAPQHRSFAPPRT